MFAVSSWVYLFRCLWAMLKIQGVCMQHGCQDQGWRIKMVPGSVFQNDLSLFKETLIQSCKFRGCINLRFAQPLLITQSFHTADLLHRTAFGIFLITQHVIQLVFTQVSLLLDGFFAKLFASPDSIGSLHDNLRFHRAHDNRHQDTQTWILNFIWISRCQFNWLSDWSCDSFSVGRRQGNHTCARHEWKPSAKLIWPVG